MALAVLVVVRGGQAENPDTRQALAPEPTASVRPDEPNPFLLDAAPAPVDEAPSPSAEEPASGTDCDEVRGTEYRSDSERAWFLETCVVRPQAVAARSAHPPLHADSWALFLAGYLASGGRPEWADKFVRVLSTCEGSKWAGYHGVDDHGWPNGYWSRAQFSTDTWAKVRVYLASLGLAPNPDDPYQVGLAVGWWSSRTNPATQWPYCWANR